MCGNIRAVAVLTGKMLRYSIEELRDEQGDHHYKMRL